ncbi:Sodium-dependent serotonin transporter,Sodium-dependent proline transporter,Sodium-and chloride-dependent neutral and basic amino acid transporter B(0+),Sodium- and chloride-dependent glycine transporter 1,Sodium- and chloride-dependent glycine transporter 2 [Acanthosepion pharaonis]|uniref:Uncharacterized protein n=1 Tax=Acanthosepion pharaonis TaxID=158019 RepID=A0A812CST8_ACAPH|nr:Sodium-dependent serotonin transporter,Sodium-dependent proline transporter,Sodium-and chloride-dependent neutral and basic amino acid transporter B(0+),Sodium- and chloride-dependent glycine transporter 1,Sodium- and chloride-dependent glycine transporter 2 [Sepia pharaonis]
MFMELAFGQFASLGPAAIFDRFCPLFHGLGIAMVCVSSLVAIYYTVIIAWTILYLFSSFTSELPWETCQPEWKTQYCYSFRDAEECAKINGSVFYNQTCFNATTAARENLVELAKNVTRHAPAQDYFERHILNISDSIEHIGNIRWQVVLCLLCAWTLTFLSLSKGVKSTGKVVYFTALFPYVVLCILFVRGVTLPGSVNGVIFYLTPQFHKLKSAKVWKEAAVQIFFSLSPAWGGLITLASYNKFHNNCFKDALIVSIGNICTSIFAGFVIFSIIGYLANELNMPVDKVVDQGAGLAFIVYPDVVTRLPISPLWSFLFFFMLLTLGMGSEFALLETIMTAVQDLYPVLRQRKTWVVLAEFSAQEFIIEIELMIGQQGRTFHKYFSLFWKYISPATLTFLMIFNWIQYTPLNYGDYVYPGWANAIGWVMALLPLMMIIFIALFRMFTMHTELPFKQVFKFIARTPGILVFSFLCWLPHQQSMGGWLIHRVWVADSSAEYGWLAHQQSMGGWLISRVWMVGSSAEYGWLAHQQSMNGWLISRVWMAGSSAEYEWLAHQQSMNGWLISRVWVAGSSAEYGWLTHQQSMNGWLISRVWMAGSSAEYGWLAHQQSMDGWLISRVWVVGSSTEYGWLTHQQSMGMAHQWVADSSAEYEWLAHQQSMDGWLISRVWMAGSSAEYEWLAHQQSMDGWLISRVWMAGWYEWLAHQQSMGG